jgi:hypothetical protein
MRCKYTGITSAELLSSYGRALSSTSCTLSSYSEWRAKIPAELTGRAPAYNLPLTDL